MKIDRQPSQAQLATRHLQKEWETLCPGQIPPMELTTSVVLVVMQLGYSRKIVDDMILAYRKNGTDAILDGTEDEFAEVAR